MKNQLCSNLQKVLKDLESKIKEAQGHLTYVHNTKLINHTKDSHHEVKASVDAAIHEVWSILEEVSFITKTEAEKLEESV